MVKTVWIALFCVVNNLVTNALKCSDGYYLNVDKTSCIALPGKPGQPMPTDCNEKYVDLMWAMPQNDGGSDIIKNYIEKRDKNGGHWTHCGISLGNSIHTRITDLEGGHEYEFRIIAVNGLGPSRPSDPSIACKAKPRIIYTTPTTTTTTTTTTKAPPAGCGNGWQQVGSQCFQMIHKGETYVGAKEYCENLPGNKASLAQPDDIGTLHEFMKTREEPVGRTWHYWWIGAAMVKSGVMKWLTKGDVPAKYQAKLKPNDNGCIALNYKNNPTTPYLKPIACSEEHWFICGKDLYPQTHRLSEPSFGKMP